MLKSNSQFVICMAALTLLNLSKHLLVLCSGLSQPWGDSLSYWKLGSEIASGDFWMMDSGIGFRTLGYPWLIGICQVVGQSWGLFLLVVIQHAAALASDGIAAIWVFQLTRSYRVAVLAYFFAILNTARAWHSNWVLTETIATFLLILICYLAWRNWRSRFALHTAALTVLVGVAIQIRPSLLSLAPLPFVQLVLYLLGSRSESDHRSGTEGHLMFASRAKQACKCALLCVAVLAVILSPCYFRNYVLFQRFQLVTFQGRELWTATFSPWPGAGLDIPNDGPGGELRDRVRQHHDIDLRNNWSVSPALAGHDLNDAEIDELMANVSWQAIMRSPVRTLFCTGIRMVTFWYCWEWLPPAVPQSHEDKLINQGGIEGIVWCHRWASNLNWTPEWFPLSTWIWSIATWIAVVLLTLRPETRPISVLLLYVLLSTTVLTASLEIPNYRYRLLLEPLTIIAVFSAPWTKSLQAFKDSLSKNFRSL